MAIEVGLGKMNLKQDMKSFVIQGSSQVGAIQLAVKFDHALAVENFPPHHNDPFDRVQIEQATVKSMTLVTHDRVIPAYQIPILW